MEVHAALSLLDELEHGMKGLQFSVSSAQRKINSSFAILAVQALRRYLRGEVSEAHARFSALADELTAGQALGEAL